MRSSNIGGLLVSVEEASIENVKNILRECNLPVNIIGKIKEHSEGETIVTLI